jgi:hypothetical protein
VSLPLPGPSRFYLPVLLGQQYALNLGQVTTRELVVYYPELGVVVTLELNTLYVLLGEPLKRRGRPRSGEGQKTLPGNVKQGNSESYLFRRLKRDGPNYQRILLPLVVIKAGLRFCAKHSPSVLNQIETGDRAPTQ